MKKLSLDVDTLRIEKFETNPSMKQKDGTVHAYVSDWYSDPCRFCNDYPISVPPNFPC